MRRLLVRLLFAAVRRRIGAVPDSWRALSVVPRVLLARAWGDAVHASTREVAPDLAGLALLRAATLVECEFCIDIGAAAAAHAGVTHDKIRDLARWRDSETYDALERRVLALTDAMTTTPAAVPPDVVDNLREELGDAAVVELVTAIGHENARARSNRALGIAPQGFAAAAACPVPDAVEMTS